MDLKAAPDPVATNIANAANFGAMQEARTRAVFVRIAVAIIALALPLSFAIPAALLVRSWRRGIASSTWPGRSTNLPMPFTADALQADTGKLCFAYFAQLFIGIAVNGFSIIPVAICYVFGRNPMVSGAAVLLTAVVASRFPVRDRIAAWIERQQGLLDQERQTISSPR